MKQTNKDLHLRLGSAYLQQQTEQKHNETNKQGPALVIWEVQGPGEENEEYQTLVAYCLRSINLPL